MRDSLIISMKYADLDIIDGSPHAERHHCIGGIANRKKADEDGLWIPLSHDHHTAGADSAHRSNVTHKLIQMIGQLAWEREYYKIRTTGIDATEAFRKRYGKSFL